MKRYLGSIFSLMLVAGLLAIALPTKANRQVVDNTIPEVDGTYNDPGNPGVKVRVFVDKIKVTNSAAKPGSGGASSPTCNLSDPDSSAVVPEAGWKLPTNVTYKINTGSVPSSVGGSNLATIAANSFGAWSSALAGARTFNFGGTTNISRQSGDGQNIIAWGNVTASALGVTYVRYNTTSKVVVDVDTIMNNKVAWKWSGTNTCAYPNVYDAQNILTHEIGHWAGLNDVYTSDYVDNTMYGYGSLGESKKNTLTTGDTAGVRAIY